ncbi:MAG TPA: hypothetical protein VGP17_06425 [Solirubrobacteraceae bacterium]|nr:hypothetical protein [Solirubrobacteraceae bacterium]
MARMRSAGFDELSARPEWQPVDPVSLQSWVTGQNRVRPPKAPHSEAGNSKGDPLIQQLGEIGRDPTELERKDLSQYPALLESAEVQQRVGVGADDADPASCAVRAIKDFIDKIDDTTEKQVVMAALAVTEQFSGTGITKRMPAGISKSTFQRIRDRQFAALAAYLRCYPRTFIEAEHSGVQLTDEQRIYIQYGLDSLMQAAFTLHYAGIANLFTREHGTGENHTACDEYLFYSFLHFLTRATNWSAIPPPARVAEAGIELSDRHKLTTEADRQLVSLIADVTECWPLAEYDRRQMSPVFETVHEFGSLYHRDLYTDMWQRHYKEGSLSDTTELVTAQSGLLAEALYPYRHQQPKLDDAERLARRALECFYWRHFNDIPFRNSVSSYFRDKSVPLVKSLQW